MYSASSSSVPRVRRVALAVCMFLITGTVGFLQPFVPLYLEAAGLKRGQIGIVTGVGAALALLVQPLLGRLSDRLDARRPVMVAAALVAGLSYFAYRLVPAGNAYLFVLLTALGSNGFGYLNVVGGVLVGRMVGTASRSGGAAYASYRVWGSVGYIVVSLVTGWLVSRGLGPRAGMGRAELTPVFLYGPLLFFVIALVSLLVPDLRRAPVAAAPSTSPPPESPGLSGNANLRRFLLAFFLYQFALYGASAYLSLFLKSLGASPLWITGTFAAGVVCEVLVMVQVGGLTDTYGRRPALAIAFLLMPLRLLLYIPATGPLWVLLVQTLHGVNFGIMGTIAVAFINDLTTDRDRGAAQARLAGTSGLATALAPAVCGWMAQYWGIGWMFAAMSLIGAAAAFIFMTQVHESHPSPLLLRPSLRWLSGGPRSLSPAPDAAEPGR